MNVPTLGKNRLAHETSPYLLQHSDNPVDWYPWGEEAFARARAENRPVLVSIGYSSCHWCHVMAHESFEDPGTAKLMNELFVCIKVDREERPDVDEVYMTAVQLLGEHGGWPLNVFLTPDGKPFYGGTYFPPERRWGKASWPDVLKQIAHVWSTRHGQVEDQGAKLTEALREESKAAPAERAPGAEALSAATDSLVARYDPRWGGFGGAPKFPPSLALQLLLRRYRRHRNPQHLLVVEGTLRGMARGGLYDQLGGGFHRYSVDERWLVPHFEKMLYDNAQLARVYVEAWQVTGEAIYARIARETLEWVLREMTEPEGAFRSATDADSEGREGLYFAWTKPEIESALDDDASLFEEAYGVTEEGNFEDPHHDAAPGEPGMNVLHVAVPADALAARRGMPEADAAAALARDRARLLALRQTRTYPGLDDKVLTAWNALMIGTLAYAGRVLDEPRYVDASVRAADFVLTRMRTPEGRLLRTWRKGEAKIPAFLEDHAFLANALLDVYEATFDARYYREAEATAREMNARFRDPAGGWFHTAEDGEALVARPSSGFDGSIPSANGTAATVCARFAVFTGDAFWRERTDAALRRFAPSMERAPGATISLLLALEAQLSPGVEVAIVGDPDDVATARLTRTVQHAFLPFGVLAAFAPSEGDGVGRTIPLLAGKTLVGGRPAVYVCRNFACQAPATEDVAVTRMLAES